MNKGQQSDVELHLQGAPLVEQEEKSKQKHVATSSGNSDSPVILSDPRSPRSHKSIPSSSIRGRGYRTNDDDGDEDNYNQPINQSKRKLLPSPTTTICGYPVARFYRNFLIFMFIMIVIFVTVFVAIIYSKSATTFLSNHMNFISKTTSNTQTPISSQDAISKCLAAHSVTPILKTASMDRRVKSTLLIQHATIWNGLGDTLTDADLFIENGKISAVSQQRIEKPGVSTIDAQSRIVTPGIVDMHNHAGVYAWPDILATQDGNEMTNPVFPQVRAIDAFDPDDWAIPLILSGGITTAQILPGSGNNMGGEGTVVKLNGRTVQDMLIPDAPRILKMACGENPKRVYGDRDRTPMSRMGSAWVMRQKFEEARKLMQLQDSWCSSPDTQTSPFPTELSLDPVVALLRGQARLHNHCYEIQDLEMMIRLSKEFNFRISAFHHALEAYKIPDVIRENNITVATFSDLWGYKKEAYDASVYAPKILTAAGVPVALKSDHPVLFSKDMSYEAAKSHYYGLDTQKALAAITSVPAKSMGLGDRLGSIAVGLDGDVVIWDRDPFVLGAKPDKVIIEGNVVVDNHIPFKKYPSSSGPPASQLQVQTPPGGITVCNDSLPNYVSTLYCYMIRGATIYTMNGPAIPNGDILIQNGMITCLGASCTLPSSCYLFTLNGGSVIPGLIEALSHVGQEEIGQEPQTQDVAKTSDYSTIIQAIDGIRLQTRHVTAAWAGGVNTVISAPQGPSRFLGYSTAFRTCCGVRVEENLLKSKVAFHMTMSTSAVSEDIAALRMKLSINQLEILSNSTPSDPVFADILKGDTILAVHVHQADAINSLLRIKNEFNIRLVIEGAAEAYLISNTLGRFNVSVVLQARSPPDNFIRLRSSEERAIKELTDARVSFGLGMADTDNVRNLRWEGGWAKEYGLSLTDAIAAVTSNIADIYNIGKDGLGRLILNTPANLLAFDGDPLSLQSRIQINGIGTFVGCRPTQR